MPTSIYKSVRPCLGKMAFLFLKGVIIMNWLPGNADKNSRFNLFSIFRALDHDVFSPVSPSPPSLFSSFLLPLSSPLPFCSLSALPVLSYPLKIVSFVLFPVLLVFSFLLYFLIPPFFPPYPLHTQAPTMSAILQAALVGRDQIL